jgi:serine/threonine protein kinase
MNPPEHRTGDVLAAKYRLASELGRGGMGTVFRAEHLTLRSAVAVKLIHPGALDAGTVGQRFLREAQAAASIRSPHVVQILDFGVESGTPFMVMELLEGESLAARLGRVGRLEPTQAARVVTHVARAIQMAHDAGVVHRDLKPDNVFLVCNADEEIAKVLDFGIAKSLVPDGIDTTTRTGAVLGTPYYMSPEQARGTRAVDAKSDLWALGVIACECMTGRRPFDGPTLGDLMMKICSDPIPAPSSLGPVPPGFDAWFQRATEREPERRFQSALELADSLRAVVGLGESQLSLPPPPASAPFSASSAVPSQVLAAPRSGFPVGVVMAVAALAFVIVAVAGVGLYVAFGTGPAASAAPSSAESTQGEPAVDAPRTETPAARSPTLGNKPALPDAGAGTGVQGDVAKAQSQAADAREEAKKARAEAAKARAAAAVERAKALEGIGK